LRKLLLTGFDPFGGEMLNPAIKAVMQTTDHIGDIQIIKKEIPTSFRRSKDVIIKLTDEIKPDFIISVGQAGGRNGITIERVAINCMDATISDNDGIIPEDEFIIPDGPAAYFSSLPIKNMAEAIKNIGIRASVSNTAGTFVCNALMYNTLHYIASAGADIKSGFIHVPYLPEQILNKNPEIPSMELETIVSALEAAISVLS